MQDKHSYTSLYEGLFQEVFTTQPTEQYGHIVYHTNTRQLSSIDTTTQEHELIDPVAFAYDFGARIYDAKIGRWMSTDNYEKLAPAWTPYRFGLDNPIRYIDSDGNIERDPITGQINFYGSSKKTFETASGGADGPDFSATGYYGFIKSNSGNPMIAFKVTGVDYNGEGKYYKVGQGHFFTSIPMWARRIVLVIV